MYQFYCRFEHFSDINSFIYRGGCPLSLCPWLRPCQWRIFKKNPGRPAALNMPGILEQVAEYCKNILGSKWLKFKSNARLKLHQHSEHTQTVYMHYR